MLALGVDVNFDTSGESIMKKQISMDIPNMFRLRVSTSESVEDVVFSPSCKKPVKVEQHFHVDLAMEKIEDTKFSLKRKKITSVLWIWKQVLENPRMWDYSFSNVQHLNLVSQLLCFGGWSIFPSGFLLQQIIATQMQQNFSRNGSKFAFKFCCKLLMKVLVHCTKTPASMSKCEFNG
jgi:hypothetical protein